MESASEFIMPAAIAIIMFGIGLELKFKDFRRVFTNLKGVLIGLGCQLFILPALALCIIYYWPIEPIHKIGIMLIAACPGGTASNLVTKILKGRVALSISLTAFNSFLILFTIPLIIEFSYMIFDQDAKSIDLGFWETMKQVFFTVVLPVFTGIGMGKMMKEKHTEKLHQPLNFILPAILVIAVITVLVSDESKQNISYLKYLHILIPLFILNIVTIIVGFIIARRSSLKHDSAYTIAIEMGLQNSVLALFIASQLLKSQEISLIAILYGSFSLISTFGVAFILKKYFAYGIK
ncbi:bile acid:sodium symporter family protein [Christiangramia echinicola]|uniref:Bile acid:Na+ symporter, BASS family n=1 Tax=Christiangramia echinicola TaxID=279359 RepID=A0A1H1NKT4_9FLAO|nr:bile acid:sodium symporter family protein [Christiangramia echinicola]SDR99651.1 bile acid:Na+ symporter, BASS family [Christiangramia echinicola]